ncbi:MAG: prepilin-type N-terminal cleavage/methylation domain-containing protein [Armatimonadetes bacterium]|nr:prepilin-type N-terminal cleavage/methylation domain-containing protein [Armatimonadota bacterium]
MLKKAFTLIELLVVIAIIAILAAILFPVFTQAKTAAKKTVAISNQKQISLGFMLYIDSNDDQYPRRSGCELNTSLNTKLNDGVLRCSGGTGFGHSMTWQSWQKYVMPYIKSVGLFEHPLRTKSATDWNNNGQFLNAFAINLGVTGSSVSGFISTPWTGGTQGGISYPSETMLLLEMPQTYAAPFVVKSGGWPTDPTTGFSLETIYPIAIREYWRSMFLKSTSTNNCTTSEEVDQIGAPAGGVVVGFADGSAKFLQVGKFLGNTPTNAQYMGGVAFPASAFASNCRRATSAYVYSGSNNPNTSLNFPMWNLGQ